eukprot:4213408-Prymnesium_polylepis.1
MQPSHRAISVRSRWRAHRGAPCHFRYGAAAGASGCFKARLHHASVEPQSDQERPAQPTTRTSLHAPRFAQDRGTSAECTVAARAPCRRGRRST